MKRDELVSDRLAQFRSEWPRRVTWAQVRAEEPRAFRSAVTGALLVIPTAASLLLWCSLNFEVPGAIELPGWLDWARSLLTVATLWLGILLGIGAWAMLSLPTDARRGMAIARFGAERSLSFWRNFAPPPGRYGILFAGGATPPRSARLRAQGGDATSLFRASFALHRGAPAGQPDLQIAIASYSGGKNDPKGPRNAFRYLEMALPRRLPHIMIDATGNGRLRTILPGSQRLRLEGDFDRYFAVYVPQGYERDALELLTPDVMACLIDHGRHWDVEIVDDRLIAASRRFRRSSDRDEYTAMLYFSELFGAELGHQARTYTDPRAANPRSQVTTAGARLKLRSAAWTTTFLVAVVAAMLAFPHTLGWFLDR